jgi:hypothetical protein
VFNPAFKNIRLKQKCKGYADYGIDGKLNHQDVEKPRDI